jgi:hypothetical protein
VSVALVALLGFGLKAVPKMGEKPNYLGKCRLEAKMEVLPKPPNYVSFMDGLVAD